MASGYVAATVPAKIVRVSHTTLFQIAMTETGDALNWVSIAQLNGLIDPWIVGQTEVLIPPVFPTTPTTGILGL